MLATSCTQQVLVQYGASPCHPGPLMRRVQTSYAWHMAPSTHGWPAAKAAFRTADTACVRACSSSAGRHSLAPVVPPAQQAARMPCCTLRLLGWGGSRVACCSSSSNNSDSQIINTGGEFDGVEDSVSQTEPQISEAHVMLPALGSNAAGELDLSEPLIQQQQAEETQSSDSAEPSSGGSPGPGEQGESSEASSKASQKRSPSPPPGSSGSLSLEGTPIWSPKLLVGACGCCACACERMWTMHSCITGTRQPVHTQVAPCLTLQNQTLRACTFSTLLRCDLAQHNTPQHTMAQNKTTTLRPLDPAPQLRPHLPFRRTHVSVLLLCPWAPTPLQVKVAMVLVFGVTNRVLYKQALVPMQNYVFFLAQFQNIGEAAMG